ncbi:MAG: cation diffusion facilitator family transporter [Bacteroidetes bacterium]|nr:cation diffusion facilitator family transporter [Bacteroidota bacterium]
MERKSVNPGFDSKRLWWAITVNVFITVAQIVGGFISGSLSLLSDAVHNFGDALALFLSWIAFRIGRRPYTTTFTFGYKRAEILAAMVNAAALVVVGLVLIIEAFQRLITPEIPSAPIIMIVLGILGMSANMVGVLLLHRNTHQNLNVRSAYLHLLSDAIASAGIIVGGVCIWFWSVSWIDPLLTIAIALYVVWESYDILKNSTNILMMAAPKELSLEDISNRIAALPNVTNVHHAHLWQMSDHDIHFEAHVCVSDMYISDVQEVLEQIERILDEVYNIKHVTIQFEYDKCTEQSLLHSSMQAND